MANKNISIGGLDQLEIEQILQRIEENLVLRPILHSETETNDRSKLPTHMEPLTVEVDAVGILRRVQEIRELMAPLFIPKDNGIRGQFRRLLNVIIRVVGHKQIGFNRDILDLLTFVAGQVQAVKSYITYQNGLSESLGGEVVRLNNKIAELKNHTRILALRLGGIQDQIRQLEANQDDLGHNVNQRLKNFEGRITVDNRQLRSELVNTQAEMLRLYVEQVHQEQESIRIGILQPLQQHLLENLVQLQSELESIRQDMQTVRGSQSQINKEHAMTEERLALALNNASNAPSRINAVYMGHQVALAKTAYGRKIYVSTEDVSLAPHILLDGYWEHWITEVFRRTVKEGMTVIDVGANIGYYTLLAADLVGEAGRVVSFEPDPDIFNLLYQSICVNGLLGRVEAVNKAVMSRAGRMKFNKFQKLQGSSGFYAGREIATRFNDTIQQFDVDTVSLDEYLLNAVSHVDVLKIDAEGAEPEIIAGARSLLAAHPTPKIFMEYVPAYYETVQGLISNGFRVSAIDPDATLRSIGPDQLTDRQDWVMLYMEK